VRRETGEGSAGEGTTAGASLESRRGIVPAWRIVTFSIVAMTMTVFGQTPGVSVFVDPVAADLRLSRPEISTAYSLATLAAAMLMPLAGRQIDRHGVRRVSMVVGGMFGLVVMGLALAQDLAWLALGFFGIRLLGQGALSLVARTIVALRFRAGLGKAVGVSGAISAIGLALTPLLLAAIIDQAGWRVAWLLAGLSVWLIVIPLSVRFLRPGEDRPVERGARDALAGSPGEWTRGQALRTPMFWVITLANAAVAFILTGLAFHQISILGEAGQPPTLAAANFVPQMVASVAAIAVVGPLSQHRSSRVMLTASMAVLALAVAFVPILAASWLPLLYAFALGGALGATQALEGTLYPRFFGIHAIAAIRGSALTVTIVGAALGPVVVGLVRDLTGSYGAVAPVLIWVPVAIGLAALVAPVPASRATARAAS
jgi:MFS family permease